MSKVDEVIQKAQEAFWKTVADSYPRIKTGDFPPDAAFDFSEACRRAVKSWLTWNKEA